MCLIYRLLRLYEGAQVENVHLEQLFAILAAHWAYWEL